MGYTLFEKIWKENTIAELETGETQLFIGQHLIHEVTSPQPFARMKKEGRRTLCPKLSFASFDHVASIDKNKIADDDLGQKMYERIVENTGDHTIEFRGIGQGRGILHVIAPELGLTQPGGTLACGDSHTSTHGAFGCIALGIGSDEVGNILVTQSMSIKKQKVRKIEVNGKLPYGTTAKDVILYIIRDVGEKTGKGVGAGAGYAYEYGGSALEDLTMENRMTICNMTIEGGSRIGYFNPDQTTFDYLEGLHYIPKGEKFEEAKKKWLTYVSDPDAKFDDVVRLDASKISPMVTWGINPGQVTAVDELLPEPETLSSPGSAREAYEHMCFEPGQVMLGKPINVVFLGSCTNGRYEDLEKAARIMEGKRKSPYLRTVLAIPGSEAVKAKCEENGLDKIFKDFGAIWGDSSCSMCLAMNADKLLPGEYCASTSNRNFIGRQGNKYGRTLLMSPEMAALAAINGRISDVREYK